MLRKFSVLTLFMLVAVVTTIAQDTCGEFVQTALASVDELCAETGRNQACYGHTALEVTAQADANNFQFSVPGDITDVASIQSMELSGLNQDTNTWGVVLLRVQANLPDTLPGQNVTILLFGNTQIRNAANSVAAQIPVEQEQLVSASADVNVRTEPGKNSPIIGSVSPDSTVIATGKTADNEWTRINYNEGIAWVSSQFLSGQSDELTIVDSNTSPSGPMQAFYFTTGVGQPSCNEIPGDGLLIQTPKGVGEISLTVNEVAISMGSTVYFSINDDRSLSIAPVEGAARITSGGRTRTAIAGTRVQIQLNEAFEASGMPSEPESYADDEYIENLPITALERDIEIHEALNDEDLELLLEYEAIFNNIDIDDTDELFTYLDTEEDPDIVNFLKDDLGYTEFDDELTTYFEDELGIDLGDDGYGDDYGDDSYADEYSDSGYGTDYGDDSYTDEYGDSGYGTDDSYADSGYGDDYGDSSYGD